VIPQENLSVYSLETTPDGEEFTFMFVNRNSTRLINRLRRSILNLASVIPDGLMVFFPSYQYLETVSKEWRTKSVWRDLNVKKKIFPEPHEASAVDKVLTLYGEKITSGRGEILFSMGGKMSESINLSDGLARGVIIAGHSGNKAIVFYYIYFPCSIIWS
jgi:chromosome transmission fidelity protein 1